MVKVYIKGMNDFNKPCLLHLLTHTQKSTKFINLRCLAFFN